MKLLLQTYPQRSLFGLLLLFFALVYQPASAQVQFKMNGKNMLKKKKKKQEESAPATEQAASPKSSTFAHLSEFHRDHPNTLYLTNEALFPGQEEAQLAKEYQAGGDLYLTLMLDKPFAEANGGSSLRLFSIVNGKRNGSSSYVPVPEADQGKMYLSIQLLSADGEWNLHSSPFKGDYHHYFLSKLDDLPDGPHSIGVLIDGLGKANAPVQLSGGAAGHGFKQQYASLQAAKKKQDATEQAEECKEFAAKLKHINKYEDEAYRQRATKQFVASGDGMVKRAKIFFQRSTWLVKKGKMGIASHALLKFHYVIEDSEGNFHIGSSYMRKTYLGASGWDEEHKVEFRPIYKNTSGEVHLTNRCTWLGTYKQDQVPVSPAVGAEWFSAD